MRLGVVLIIVFATLKSIALHAQAEHSSATAVVFDPLFWKDDLKLTASQYNEIRNINKEYYEAIYRVVGEHSGNAVALRNATTQLLQTRSEKIWDTFMPKQKKKWMKLSSAYHNSTTLSYLPPVGKSNSRFPG